MSNKAVEEGVPYSLHCFINEGEESIKTAPSTRLLTILRDELKLTGTKRSCDIGAAALVWC